MNFHSRTQLSSNPRTTRTLRLALIISSGAFMFAHSAFAQTSSQSTSFAQAFFIQHDARDGSIEWLGSLIIWFLLALSLSSLGLLAAMSLTNRRQDIMPDETHDRAASLLADGKTDEVVALLQQDDSYFASVLLEALAESEHGVEAMRRALDNAADEFAMKRFRRIEPLNIIGAVAPMIGLFGTVYGMIIAFQEIVRAGGSPEPVGLAAGIGTALTTTFWGLVVAIPALAGHALVRNTIDALTAEAALAAERLIGNLTTETDNAAATKPSPRSAVRSTNGAEAA